MSKTEYLALPTYKIFLRIKALNRLSTGKGSSPMESISAGPFAQFSVICNNHIHTTETVHHMNEEKKHTMTGIGMYEASPVRPEGHYFM